MAEQANVGVAFQINTEGLKAGIRAAQREFTGLTGAVAGMDKRLSMAATALNESKSAHAALAQAGIQTTASVQAQIAAWEQLEKAVQGDAVATAQIIQRKKALEGVMESSSAAIGKAGASTHRANLFMINFSRGVEDLKFGLPAVINNLEGIALGYQMMAKEAEEAGRTTKQAIIGTLTSPAGLLAVMNLAITTAYIFGGVIKKAFAEAGASAKQLKDSVSGLLGDIEADTGMEFVLPKDPSSIRALADEFRNYAEEVKSTAIEQGKFTEEWVSAGGQAVKVKVLTAGAADQFRQVRDVSAGAKERLKEMADEMEANAAAADILSKKLPSVSAAFKEINSQVVGSVGFYDAAHSYLEGIIKTMTDPTAIAAVQATAKIYKDLADSMRGETKPIAREGSIAKMKEEIDKLEEAFEYAASSGARDVIRKQIESLERQLASMTFVQENLVEATKDYKVELDNLDLVLPPLSGSIEDLSEKLAHANFMFSNAGSDADRERWAEQVRSLTRDVDKLRQVLEAPFPAGSWAEVDRVVADLDEQLGLATTSAERLAISQKMHALQVLPELERGIMNVNDALADFRINSALAMGDALVGGLFKGFFGDFKKADATDARMAIADLNAEFADLEERLATGEISYAQFAAANAQRMRDLAAANRELSLAMRSDFELALARVGNAFQGMADMAKKAFQQIAQDYTTLLVRKGIFKLISTFINPASAVLPTSTDAVGNILGSFGGNTMARVSIAPVAAVVPSGDLQISLRRADATSFRTGV